MRYEEEEIRERYVNRLDSDKFDSWYWGFAFLTLALYPLVPIIKDGYSLGFLFFSLFFLWTSYIRFSEIKKIKKKIKENK